MFYYSHHDHEDPIEKTNADKRWGLRTFDFADPADAPAPNDTHWFTVEGFAGQPAGSPARYLHERFDVLMGT